MVMFDGIAITSFESRQITSKRIINQIGSSCENKTRWAEQLRLHHVIFNYFESLQSFMESLPKEKIQKKEEKRAIICQYRLSQKETLLILYLTMPSKRKYTTTLLLFFHRQILLAFSLTVVLPTMLLVLGTYLLSFTLPLHIKIELF